MPAGSKRTKKTAARPAATARWVGKDALRELTSDGVTKRLVR